MGDGFRLVDVRGEVRFVAKRLFGDLGAPMASLPEKAVDEASWRAAIREWVDDFLFMTLPTEPAQTLCAALFRHEVTRPTKFHAEFLRDFGKPVYDSLRNLLARAIPDETQLDLWTTSIWAQVSVYALADKAWHASFRPADVGERAWAEQVRDHICATLFASVKFPKKDRAEKSLNTPLRQGARFGRISTQFFEQEKKK